MTRNNGVPLRVDPDFWLWAKEMTIKDPSLNQRKITKNIAKKKVIIGEIMFNPDFEEIVREEYQRINKNAFELEDELQKRLGN